jgi:hypothetical protein
MTNNKKPANKNSIIRVIISNFDENSIKEIKVLYTKQGGVDTIHIKKMSMCEEDKSLYFEEVECNSQFGNIDIKIEKDNRSVIVEKYDKYTGLIIRKYKIFGTYVITNKNIKLVKVYVQDILNEKSTNKRRIESYTERLLIDPAVINDYKKIMENNQDIDSKNIYKLNRFINYRSNMMLYFTFVYRFLGMELGTNGEVYKLDQECNLEKQKKVVDYVASNIEKFVENHNNYAQKRNEETEEKKLHRDKEILIEIDKKLLEKDIKNIITIVASVRHKLAHYNYTFFQDLLEGKEIVLEKQKPLNELLDLNIFKEIGKIKNLKEEKATTYLEDDTKVYVLGKHKKAKKLYNYYDKLCTRKDGFNNFINSFFSVDGNENPDFKKHINEHFEKRIDELNYQVNNTKKVREDIKRELVEMQEIKKLIGEAYIWDIHQCKEYKRIYNKRKNLVEEVSQLSRKANRDKVDKDKISKLNNEILKMNTQMEKYTKLNSKFRLQYKLQMAYGFLYEEYGFDLKRFGDRFNSSILDELKPYKENGLKYLKTKVTSNDNIGFSLGEFEKKINAMKAMDNGLFNPTHSNNLFKWYVLMYILLPTEIRGDFLGFVKNQYYELKHVDYIEDQVIEKDLFFHRMRLFEKNTKKLSFISYGIDSLFDIKEYFNYLLPQLNPMEMDDHFVNNFTRSMVLPMLKYYQNIFKLLNDLEVASLIKYSNVNNIHLLSEAIANEKLKKNGNYNFNTMLQETYCIDAKCGWELSRLRNEIAHLNIDRLFIEIPKNDELDRDIDKLIDFLKKPEVNNNGMAKTIINDFYMRHEQFMHKLNVQINDSTSKQELEDKYKAQKKLLNRFQMNPEAATILKKYEELKAIENINQIDLDLWGKIGDIEIIDHKKHKKISDLKPLERNLKGDLIIDKINEMAELLFGIYKRYMVRDIKKILHKQLTKNESRYINLLIYDKMNSEEALRNKEIIYTVHMKKDKEKWKIENDEVVNEVMQLHNIEIISNEKGLLRCIPKNEASIMELDINRSYIQKMKIIVSNNSVDHE